MKKIVYILLCLLPVLATAQVRNPLIPSKKNDALLREQAQREAALRREQGLPETDAPTPNLPTTRNNRTGNKTTNTQGKNQAANQTAKRDTEQDTQTNRSERREKTVGTFDPDSVLVSPLPLQPLSTTEVDYVPEAGYYVVHTKIGDVDIATPYMLTEDEYAHFTEQQMMNAYWKKKISEVDHNNEKKFDITDMKFNIGPADKIFGPGGVQLKMQGSAELLFGFKHQFIDNPALTLKARNNNIFDFDEKIQASVQGKVGTRLNFNLNYNSEASFSFDQQNLKLAYKGEEDDIIQSIEAGNVTMDLNSSLIRGSQALFGVKTNLKFGKLKIQALISQQNSTATNVTSEGGRQTTNFEVSAQDYDDSRHFFLGYFFRDHYEESMATLPYIASGVTINKIEVWVTNRKSNFTSPRNIVAFADLGEREANPATGTPNHIYSPTWHNFSEATDVPRNRANNLYGAVIADTRFRDISLASTAAAEMGFQPGVDFEKVESARLLTTSEYTLNSALGYISLKSALQADEVLAVAYEYTYGGQVYQVGEFSTDRTGEEGDAPSDAVSQRTLVLKLLKTNGNSPVVKNTATWDLMMKNVYSIGATTLSQEGFEMQVMYRNDSVGTDVQFISEGKIKGIPLLRVMNLDQLDARNNRFSDGKFDYVSGYTVNASTGRIIFPVLEPFGSHLKKKIGDDVLAEKYIFQELYDSTLVSAAEETDRNKFFLRGKFAGASSNEISLGAMNVPRGSVTVTAGGAKLTENVDYTVDYTMGKVTILNESILESGTAVNVSLENQATFSMQRKTLVGAHLEYEFRPDFTIGGTIMHMNERPLTTKVNSGSEPIANTIWGLNLNYRTELPWLNTALNAIPWINATAPSSFAISAEFAQLIPGHTREVGKAGTSYVDDFESSTTSIDIHYPSYWKLASTPQGGSKPFPEASLSNNTEYNKNRAMLAWYTVDPIFGYPQSNTPQHIRDNVDLMCDHRVRIIYEQEIYPNKEVLANEDTRLSALNLAFYPQERGPYNIFNDMNEYNTDGYLKNPKNRWGGIMRKIDQTDFEKANIEYIEFWLMDPAYTNPEHPADYGTDLYINLGDVSEDILKDGKKSFENGLPTTAEDLTKTTNTIWGRVAKTNSTVTAFSNEAGSRQYQDLGLNGLNNDQEHAFEYEGKKPYEEYAQSWYNHITDQAVKNRWYNDPFSPINDPAGDDFHYYRGSDFDQQQTSVLDRYKHYNGTQGNSPDTENQSETYATASTLNPDIEDINSDNTLNESEKYFEYHVRLDSAHMKVGEQHIVSETYSDVELRNGKTVRVRWLQFKIPLKGEDVRSVGNIRNLKSIRFMRMYLTGAEYETHLRFGSLSLVRGEWRTYTKPLYEQQYAGSISGGDVNVQAINIEENGRRQPVNYILPPGISRQTDPGQAQLVAQNEQALVLGVEKLCPHDARAVYRQLYYDMRNYKRLQMFVHAEKTANDESLVDGNLTCFIRLGSDLRSNYYEYEIPLSLTPWGTYNNDNEDDRYKVWPTENYFDFPFTVFTDAKKERNTAKRAGTANVGNTIPYVVYDEKNNKVTVLGNPSLGEIEYVMIGVRNNGSIPHSGEVWVNELRLNEFNEEGGVAAMANMSLAISDIAQFNVTGRLETAGYGSIESNVGSRNMEDQYNVALSAALEAGRLVPEKARLQIPLYVSYSNQTVKPKYDPLDSDTRLDETLETYNDRAQRDSVKQMSNTVQETTTFSLTNLRVNIHSKKRDMFYDPANFSITTSYSQQKQHTPEIEKDITTDHRGAFQYSYNFNPQPWEPFAKVEKVSKVKFLKEMNFYYLPQSWSFNTNMHRTFTSTRMRDLTASGYSVQDMTTYSKDFTWDRNFDFKYNLTKNMKFSFQTAMNSTVDEGMYTKEIIRDFAFTNDYYEAWKDTIQRSLAKWGSPYTYQQVFNATWSVPFNRIPYLECLTANASYNANYNWARTQSGGNGSTSSLGNTVSSVRTWQIDGGANLEQLYNKSKYWKQMTQHYSGRNRNRPFKAKTYNETIRGARKDSTITVTHRLASENLNIIATDTAGNRISVKYKTDGNNAIKVTPKRDCDQLVIAITTRNPNERSAAQITGDMFAYVGTMIRRIQVTYRNTTSLTMPGFRNEVGFMGQDRVDKGLYAPGFDFAFGFFGDDFVDKTFERGWLSQDSLVVQPATMAKTEDLDIKMTLEPLPGLKIQLNSKRYQASTSSIIYTFGDMRETQTGSFNITDVAIGTAFKKIGSIDDNFASSVFDQFLRNRETMQGRVQQRYDGLTVPGKTVGAVSRSSADVLIPAFLAAYTGRDVEKMSHNPFSWLMLPNWSVTFDGLGKLPWMRDHFRSVTLTHAYTCKYSIGAYNGFSTWMPADDAKDRTLGFTADVTDPTRLNPSSAYDITSVSLSESFSPLIGLNLTMKNSLSIKGEYRKQRNLALNVTAVQLTEGHTDEFVIGTGYTIKNLNFTTKNREGVQKKVSNDLKLSVDFSYKNVKTFLRKVDEGIAQASSGNKVFTIKVAADYVLSQKINLQLFYDHEGTTPLISTSYPVKADNVGINIKLMLTR